MGRFCITDSEISWVLPLLLFFHWSHSPGHPYFAANKRMVHRWKMTHCSLPSVPKWKNLLLLFISWGIWIRKAHLVSCSCLIISTDQSHTNGIAVILSHLYGNFHPLQRHGREDVLLILLNSFQIWNYLNSLNLKQQLTGQWWKLFLFPTPVIGPTSSRGRLLGRRSPHARPQTSSGVGVLILMPLLVFQCDLHLHKRSKLGRS